ncbi:hypothetical protein MVES1_003152 [Malassezia vespertilionis]|uniref:uncharacterized protein n=1 Tax=Malassezia vespertilionis TaxID=2020962 RepID=UPI0024B16952|nr:uncharacterized protein MVES1_003152 [Malassezia vespertilionis]WFD07781.1 hypothetical protein MVES1_003152 [Malassezia vespertilionis]
MFGAQSFTGFGQQNQGANNTTQSAGGGMFGQATPGGFGTAFGQSTTPAFGQTPPATTPAFGQPASTPGQPAPFSFGQNTAGSSFGAPKPAAGFGTFGASTAPPAQTSFGTFGGAAQPPKTAFGAAPAPGTAFNAPSSTPGFFGQQAAPQPNAFGPFGAAAVPAQPSVTQGSATVPFAPFREDATPNEPKAHAKSWDVHQSISSMPAYASMSPEELRLQDYQQGRQKGTTGPGAAPGAAPAFGYGAQPAQGAQPAFGQSQPQGSMFGQPSAAPNAFGQPAPSAAPSTGMFGAQNNAGTGMFGANKPAGSAFGAAPTSLFGQNQAQNQSAAPFGQAQPPANFSFGASATQPSTSNFSFGANNAQGTQNRPLFSGAFGASSAQPAAQPAAPPATQQNTGFSFGASTPAGGVFGQNNATPQASTGAGTPSFSFGAKPAAPSSQPFGSAPGGPANTASTFGGFNTNTQNQNKPAFSFGTGSTPANTGPAPGGTSLFGQGTQPAGGLFNRPPANTIAPAPGTNPGTSGSTGFSFGQPAQPSGGTFGAKPAAPSTPLFGASAQPPAQGAPFSQPSQPAPSLGGSTAPSAQKPFFSFGNPSAGAPSTSLFGQSQPAQPSSLFGQSQPAPQNNVFGQSMAKPLGASAPAPSLGTPPTLTTNPYGTDALLANTAPQAPLPFNVAPKNKPPLVSPFRSSPRNAVRVTRLRGATPALELGSARERTPFRESTPGPALARSTTPLRATSLFSGPSDAPSLSPQAFLPRSTSKRLVLHGDTSFGAAQRTRREATPLHISRARFSPAAERVVQSPAPDDTSAFVLPRAEPSAAPLPPPKHGDYATEPSLAALRALQYDELAAVPDFVVRRLGFGEVAFLEPVDLTTVPDLGYIAGGVVQLRAKECFVYPQDDDLASDTPLDGLKHGYVPVPKSPLGQGLNVPARVSLEGCWPLDRATREPLRDASLPRVKQHITKLKNKKETEFVSYDAAAGTWTFIVQHFSRYGLDDSDDETPSSPSDDSPPPMQLGDSDSSTLRESELSEQDEEEDWAPAMRDAPLRSTAVPDVVRMQRQSTEARKVHVMRASFFGQAPPSQGPAGGMMYGPRSGSVVPGMDAEIGAAEVAEVAGFAGFAGAAGAADADADAADADAADADAADAPAPSTSPVSHVRVPLPDSILNQGLFSRDPALSFARSFRIGWGPRLVYVDNGTQHAPHLLSTLRMRCVERAQSVVSAATPLLETQLHNAVISTLDGIPFAQPKPGTRFATIAQLYAPDDKRYDAQLWHLGAALFDPIELHIAHAPSLQTRVEQLRRKAAFSAWLARAVAGQVQNDVRAHVAASRKPELVFAYMTGYQIEQAADAALEAHDPRLATLVAQAGGDAATRAYLAEQLDVWRAEHVDPFIAPPMRRVYELLSGNVLSTPPDAQNASLAIAHGLDWRRALGLHVWYAVPWEAQLKASVDSYEAALTRHGDTAPPLPAYRDATHLGVLARRALAQHPETEWDAMYELLKLHVDPAYPLERALDARSFGPSAVDHTLPWHVYVLLARALRLRDFTDAEEDAVPGAPLPKSEQGARLTLAYAAQLEASGAWTWAAFVLLYLEHASVRASALHALLQRNSAALDDEAAFLAVLQIPSAWCWEAKAVAAHAANDYYREYQCWLEAGALSAAHRIAVTYLAPEAFVRGDPALLVELFSPFQRAEQAARENQRPFTVQHWNEGGRVFLDYAALPQLLPPLMAKAVGGALDSSERHALQQATERTHALVAATLHLFPASDTNVMCTVARTEMLAVLHNLARLLASHALAPEPEVHWTVAHPPEIEQLQAAAADMTAAVLASVE